MTGGGLTAAIEDLLRTEDGSEIVKIQHGESVYDIQDVSRTITGDDTGATITIRFVRQNKTKTVKGETSA